MSQIYTAALASVPLACMPKLLHFIAQTTGSHVAYLNMLLIFFWHPYQSKKVDSVCTNHYF